MFKVKTDNKIQNQLEEMKNKIKELSSYFEKGDGELTAVEYSDLNLLINSSKQDFNQLVKEVYKRIEMK